jgi:hypothetical protein
MKTLIKIFNKIDELLDIFLGIGESKWKNY